MTLPDSRRLKNAASDSIMRAACDPRKLVAFHTAVILAVSLLVLLIDFVLEQQIGNTGGLGGVGARSALTTIQTILQQGQLILLPFWQFGWTFVTLKIVRGESANNRDLLEGFRRFPALLRLTILKGLIFIGLALGAMYAASFVVMLLPSSEIVVDMGSYVVTEQLMEQMEQMMVPMMIISCVMALVIILPFYYRFRMAEFALLDNPGMGARAALRYSRQLMQGNMWRMIRLDLSFWWFGLLSMAVSFLSLADVFLPMMGIELPWAPEIGYFVACLLSAVAQLALYYFCKAQVDITYAHAYLALGEETVYESN